MEKDLQVLRDKLRFDPRLLTMNFDTETENAFTRRMYEYKIWSMGNAGALAWFYRTGNASIQEFDYNKMNYFWSRVPANRRMIHSGIPGLISTRMADILFKNGVKVSSVIYKNAESEALKEDKAQMAKADEFLQDTFLPKLNLTKNIQTAAVNESWGGHCFFKLSHDISVSAYPILETFDITKCEVVKERGLTTAIIFKNWYEFESKTYRLDEIYTTTEDNDACIIYKLFTFENNKEIEVDLLSIPQTQEVFYLGENGNDKGIHLDEQQRFVYEGLKGLLAFEKPNKSPSLEFPSSNYGASDYEGAIDQFDALDEITSANIREIRTNETKRYIPENLIPRDEKGKLLPFDEFCDSYEKVNGDVDQDAQNKIDTSEIKDKTDSYLSKWKTVLSMVCNKAKISPYSLGITWLEAVGPSAESQLERNKTTLDMRKGKLLLWEKLLKDLILQALKMNAWMQQSVEKVKDIQQDDGVPEIEFTDGNTTIQLDFGDYVTESVSQRLTAWGAAKNNRVASTEECIRQIHPDWTDKQVMDEVNIIRFEEGTSLDNPNNLPNLTGTEDDDQEETEKTDVNNGNDEQEKR